MGYLARGSAATQTTAVNSAQTAANNEQGGTASVPQPTPEQLKQMADTQAQPLLEQLKTDPNNAELLSKVGNFYYDAQQYAEAAKYYESALRINPMATDVRTDLGTAYHLMGQADQAIKEYDEVLKIDRNHPNALFNEGMVKWQDKMDMKGAISAWKHLLETNPNFAQRDRVEQLIAQAEQHASMKSDNKMAASSNAAQ